MSDTAQNLRELVSLARMLREFAHAHINDDKSDLFSFTAVELEARAHLIATTVDVGEAELQRDTALHAPVDCTV